jgi:hypothetical protein
VAATAGTGPAALLGALAVAILLYACGAYRLRGVLALDALRARR